MAQDGRIVWQDLCANIVYSIQGTDCFIYDPINEATTFFSNLPTNQEFELHPRIGKVLKLVLQWKAPPQTYLATIQGTVEG
jgi:hypothetical protein